jgi:O-antigen ligase
LFAIPGIAALIVFILARPQEFIPLLQRVPFLHLFTAFAVLGFVIDVRLRRLEPVATPTLPWAGAFLIWAVICTAVKAPDQLITRTIEMAILFALYGTIAHAVQRFRAFQVIAGVLVATSMFISAVCVHQGLSPMQCVGGAESEAGIEGAPDGRPCAEAKECASEGEFGLDYRCEHVGLFGSFSVENRVRYIGDLHDPNEVALTITALGLSLLIAFALRKHGPGWKLVAAAGVTLVAVTIQMTQSRGGLAAALIVPAVYLVRRHGFGALVPAILVAIPVLMLASRGGENADVSTLNRYEAWATGLNMFQDSPIFGVGARMFSAHHFLTAHNSFVLTLAELGLIGQFLFITIVYLSIKALVVGIREVSTVPGTAAAQVWGMALLATMVGVAFQINTLSFSYHPVLWICFGLVGAWCSAVRYHRPEFRVTMTGRDILIALVIALVYSFVALPLFLSAKGFM